MMKNEAKVNEAMENETLNGEVNDMDETELKKVKRGKGFFAANKRKIFGGVAAFAGGFLLKTIIDALGGRNSDSGDEPACLPSGEEAED